MDGRIAVDSEAGGGASFSFTVPLAPAPADDMAADFLAPDLSGAAVLIAAVAEIESSLLARRLGRWGAKTCVAIDEKIALALLPERRWDALLVDFPLTQPMIANCDVAKFDIPRRIVLIRPTERHELPALKAVGFTGYLVKPVRAASLAARLVTEDAFEDMPAESTDATNAAKNTPARRKGLSILVAEDNEINALLARALLVRLR